MKKYEMINRKSVLVVLLIVYTSFGMAQTAPNWNVLPVATSTKWAEKISPINAWREYPRPHMVRKGLWQSLNGLWDYHISPDSVNFPKKYDGKILVPFPIESAMSGVKRSLKPEQRLYYKRNFSVENISRNERLILHFGAVDYKAWVYVNGVEIGSHEGGYNEFSFDVTDEIKNEDNELIVKVFDPSELGIGPHGKQVLRPENIYYTASSGIWQTVWLEKVPASYITALKILPNIDEQKVNVSVASAGGNEVEVTVVELGKSISKKVGLVNSNMDLPIPNARLWSPESPFLYDLKIRLLQDGKVTDEITCYFGMRKVSIDKDEDGVERIFLNNKPYYQLGLLDQGFWPEGLYTPPSDEAMAFDLKIIKAMGFNCIRKHIKIEPARWYYYADKIGLVVWQDMVNPQQDLSEEGKRQYEAQVKESVEQLFNFPSITTWVIFNERWGAYEQGRLSKWVKQMDPTRLVNTHSGEYLYVNGHLRETSNIPYEGSDMTDVHSYPEPRDAMHLQGKARVIGEFGGIGLSVPGHQWDDLKSWGYIHVTADTFEKKYSAIVEQLRTLKEKGLSASIYTQPFDVEGEENGLLTYDRSTIKIPLPKLQALHKTIVDLNGENFEKYKKILVQENLRDNELCADYRILLNEFKNGRHDSTFLRTIILRALKAGDKENLNEATRKYLRVVKDVYADANIALLQFSTTSTKDEGFRFFIVHAEKINQRLRSNMATEFIDGLILKELKPKILADKNIKPDFERIEAEMSKQYGREGKKILLQVQAFYFYKIKDINNWFEVKCKIHEEFPNSISVFDMNNDAWLLFTTVDNRKQLEVALSWSKKVIDQVATANYYDTYSNILYKLGNKELAIQMEEKGLKLPIGNAPIDEIVDNLKKMKKGEKTWP